MKVTHSLDWDQVRNSLKDQLNQLSYNSDLRKMLKTIDTLVADLSKLEVEARQHGNRGSYQSRCESKVEEINNAINNLDKWITMAALLE
jgi:flagellin-like hook-associated protein FlgL